MEDGVFGKKKILAVIPARQGSKRIKNKNIIKFKNKPMILHTLKIAQSTSLIDKVIVSTNSKKILNICKKEGDETPFLREKAFDDKSSVHEATLHAIDQAERHFGKFDIVIQMMPNCPLRTKNTLNKAIKNFFSKKYNSQISFFKFILSNPWWAHKIDKKKIKPLFKNFSLKRSQDFPVLYSPTGSIWISNIPILKKYKTFYSKNYGYYIMDYVEAVDIDTFTDLKIAKQISKK